MLRYPIGIQSFTEIREKGYVYVDKTGYIHRLASNGKYYFLSRPRRFGKSLLMSTIEACYSGRRELFEGLALAGLDHDWTPRPVLHIDMTAWKYDSAESLASRLDSYLSRWEALYGIDRPGDSPARRLGDVIERAHEKTGQKVVILIDEYDKPLLDNTDNEVVQDDMRDELKALYGNLKSMDRHIEFAMLTGVTKFGKLSIFSDLNNLNDISLDRQYDAICGITEEELHRFFTTGVKQLAEALEVTTEEAFGMLKKNYDGYHFAPAGCDIYNPFSILNALYKNELRDYWFETGTPTFLMKMIKRQQMQLSDLNHYQAGVSDINSVSFSLGAVIPVLYQSGYLTIKGYDREFDTVTLGYPNQEVERAFLSRLMQIYTRSGYTPFNIKMFVEDVRSGKADEFMKRLQSLFSGYQYDQIDLGNLELHYRNVIYLTMKLMGFYTRAEMQTSSGRIDLVVETAGYIYLFEFKIDRSARAAIDQINNRDYLIPYRADGRKIIKVGVNFSSKTRGIDGWIIE